MFEVELCDSRSFRYPIDFAFSPRLSQGYIFLKTPSLFQ